jgi:hypothetical protein
MTDRQTALRALIVAIPHVGRSIERVFVDPPAKEAERRLQFMFTMLHREMRMLDESGIRTDFLESAEWADLVKRSVTRAAQTSDSLRLGAIARILAATATGTVRFRSDAPAVMDILANTQDEDEAVYC